jgi:hypothetical protein
LAQGRFSHALENELAGSLKIQIELRVLIRQMSMENPVLTENPIRVVDVMESPKLAQ